MKNKEFLNILLSVDAQLKTLIEIESLMKVGYQIANIRSYVALTRELVEESIDKEKGKP